MWYKVLKVRKNANRQKIEKAYQKLSAHPDTMYDVNRAVELRKAYNEGLAQLNEPNTSSTQHVNHNPSEQPNLGEQLKHEFTQVYEETRKSRNSTTILTGLIAFLEGVINSIFDSITGKDKKSNISEERKQEIREEFDKRTQERKEMSSKQNTTNNQNYSYDTRKEGKFKLMPVIGIALYIIYIVIPAVIDSFWEDNFNISNSEHSIIQPEQDMDQLDEMSDEAMLANCLLGEFDSDTNYDDIAETIEDKGYTVHHYGDILSPASKLVDVFWLDEISNPTKTEPSTLIGRKDVVIGDEDHEFIFYFDRYRRNCELAIYDAFDSSYKGDDVFFIRYMQTNINTVSIKIKYNYYIVSKEDGENLENIGSGQIDTLDTYSLDLYKFYSKESYKNEVFYNEINELDADLQYQTLLEEFMKLSSESE